MYASAQALHQTCLYTDLEIQFNLRNNFSATMLDMTNASADMYKPLSLTSNAIRGITNITAPGALSNGSVRTTTGHISSKSGNIQATNETVSRKAGSFSNAAMQTNEWKANGT